MGMVIIGFAVAYALVCCSDTYYRIRMKEDLYGAFRIGFFIRLLYSVILFIPVLISLLSSDHDLFTVALYMGEGWLGFVAICLGRGIMDVTPLFGTWPLFANAVLITVIHAFLLNVALLIVVGLIYLIRRGIRRFRLSAKTRGV